MYTLRPVALNAKIRKFLLTERNWPRKVIRAIWIIVPVSLILFGIYIALVIRNPYNLFGKMPSLYAIENPENDLSSEVISSDGVSLGRYFRYNRIQLKYEDLPPALVK